MNKKSVMPTMESVDRFKAAMDSDRGALGPFMICTDPAMVEAAGHAGYDFVLLDMEHGTTTFQELPNLIRAANVTGVCPVVRVPRGSDIWIDQALDVGAGAVMIDRHRRAGACRCFRREVFARRNARHLPFCPFGRLRRGSRQRVFLPCTGHRGHPSGRGSEGDR